ncbi:unnamed protein product [Effrenium voratum]|uniref:RNA helicase n=1 Tax=Effrenium voratum TaxID=2562239 RepID=A0AA36JRG4_9DINO|nr:unnamed protein product [Effrenium voratum]
MPRFKTSDVVDAETQQCTFAELSLSAPLVRSLHEMGCERPSPVQLHTIPVALSGGDVIVQAKSGTGKTIAFCSVVLEGIDTSVAGASQALILAPTREIAMQISDELERLAWYLDPPVDVGCFIGGVSLEEDEEKLESGTPHVAVGSPGRMLKLLREGMLTTDARFLVLDEADKLLDANFRQDITAITELVFTKQLQFLAVSATFPPPLVALAEDLFVHVEKKRASRGQPVERDLPQKVFLCTSAVKKDEDGVNIAIDESGEELESALLKGVLHVRHVLQGYHIRQKMPALLEVLTTVSYQQAFVFVGDSNNAIQIAEMLNQAGVPAAASSGRMEQSYRTQAFAGLKRFQYRVLVCTDLMARGIDAENVDIVVNLDLPTEKETYLHRSGRTARFGSVGWMVSLVFEGDEAEHLNYFQVQLGFELVDYADREAAMSSRLQQLDFKDAKLGPTPEEMERFPQESFPVPQTGGNEVGWGLGPTKTKKKRSLPKSAGPKEQVKDGFGSKRTGLTEAMRMEGPKEVAPRPHQADPGFPSFSAPSPPAPAAAPDPRQFLASHMAKLGLLAPPVLPPGNLSPEIQAALPAWEPWMLDCNFAKYAEQQSPAGQMFLTCLSDSTRNRLDALWHNHCRVWIGA